MKRVTTIVLVGAILTGVVAAWLLGRGAPAERENLLTELQGSTFLSRELPEGFTASGKRLAELRQRSNDLLYVYLKGPDDRNRIKYVVFADPSLAESSFREQERALSSEALLERAKELDGVGYPAFCADYSPGIECSALVDRVVVVGESLVLGKAKSGQLEHSWSLLVSGINHLRRVMTD